MIDDKVSIIVPIYNGQKTLALCLKSIMNQTYKNFEVLLIDDGSIDNSKKICKKYCCDDSRFILYTKKNGGVSSARNFALKKASGKYICFIDCDDTISNNYLEFLISKMKQNNADIGATNFNVINNLSLINSKGVSDFTLLNKQNFLINLVNGNGFASGCINKIYKRDIIKDIEFNEVAVAEDLYFNYEIADKNDELKVFYTKSRIYNYYISHENSVMHGNFSKKNLDVIKQYDLLLKDSENKYADFNLLLKASYVFIVIKLLLKMVSSSYYDKKIYNFCNDVIEENRAYVYSSNNYSIAKKMFVFVFNFNKKAIEKCYNHNNFVKKICSILNRKVG